MPAYVATSADDMTVMPFGKQKGTPIDQIDTGYLKWWLGKMDSDGLRAEYRDSVTEILTARGSKPPEPSKGTNGLGSARLMFAAEIRCMVKSWFGAMSKRYHPDCGGKNGQQEAIVEAYKELSRLLNEWEMNNEKRI
jgi:hypothetical protein